MRRVVPLAALAVAVAACGVDHGTITAKVHDPESEYTCQVGSVPVGQVPVPIFGTCVAPECWRLDLRDGDATGSVCVPEGRWREADVGQRWEAS